MNPHMVGIGAYSRPINDPVSMNGGCGCGRGVGQSEGDGMLSEMVWVLGIGAVVVGTIAFVVMSRSFKESGF